METCWISQRNSPIGEIFCAADEECLVGLAIGRERGPDFAAALSRLGYTCRTGESAVGVAVHEELAAYFAGERTGFDVAVRLHGTEFQKQVWQALRAVPFGATVTYGELAARAGSPRAARAIGQTMARNRLPIVVPCHRVIASGGQLGGFTGGLGVKRALLAIEGHAL